MKNTANLKTLLILSMMLLISIPCEARRKPKPVQLTSQEIKAMTTRQFECSRKLIFRASLSMLQSEGFIIEDTDMETGLIKATKRIEANKKKARSNLLWKGRSVDASTAKCVIYIDEINDIRSDVRITIYDGMEMTVMGGFNTRSNKSSEEMVQDATVYHQWFVSLTAEIERLKALQ